MNSLTLKSAPLKSADVRSRVEPGLKESAADVLAQCGLTLSDGIRLFLKQVVARHGLPFDVRIPNPETMTAMNEARGMKKPRFASAPEMFNDLEKASSAKAR